MYFINLIKELGNVNIKIFVDMDGVVADYEVNNAKDYDKKRPLISNIEKLEKMFEKYSEKDEIDIVVYIIYYKDE